MAAVVALAAGRTIRCRTEASVAAAGLRWHWPAGPVPLSTAEVELAATEDRAPPPIAVYSARLAEIKKKPIPINDHLLGRPCSQPTCCGFWFRLAFGGCCCSAFCISVRPSWICWKFRRSVSPPGAWMIDEGSPAVGSSSSSFSEPEYR